MRIEHIDPREVVLPPECHMDIDYKTSIQTEGFDDEYPGVRKRADGKYDVVKGERQLRAILSLIEEDVDCHDLHSGKKVKASELYRKMLMCVFG